MALYVISLVVIISSITQNGFAQLQLHPNPLQLTKGATSGSVQITCEIPSGVSVTSVYAITISRYLKSAPTTEQRLARADVLVNQGQAALLASSGLTQNTVSGSTTQKSMTLTLTQAKCEDAGTYVCRIPYNSATGDNILIQNIDVSDNFTVIVFPGNIVTSVSPDHEVYDVNDTVELLCNASIGSYDSQDDLRWSWEYFDVQYLTWLPVQTSLQSDIRVDPPTPVSDMCYYHQLSYLTLHLTPEDSQRHFRCTFQKNDYLLLASITLGIVSPGDTLVFPSTTTGTSGSTLTTAAAATRLMCRDKTLFAVPGQVGYLSSSNYTFNNNDFIACWWTINSTSGYVVKTTILNATSPFFFFFEIRDGMWESSPILDRIGRVSSPTVYYSSGRSMYIMFVDSNHSPNTSFSLTYEAVDESLVSTSGSAFSTTTATPSICTGITLFAVPGQVGYLSSSNYTFDYSDSIECSWTINSTGGYVVKATILNATSPFYFFIDIRDGMWPSPNILAWIRGMPSQTVYYSSGQYMYMRFVDPSHSPDTYFSLTYEAVDESLVSTPETTPTSTLPPTAVCSINAPTVYVVPGQVGYLTSPNYPSPYYDDADCRWRINTTSGYVVKVSALNVSLETCCDYLEIYDGNLEHNAIPITRMYTMPSQTVFYSSGQYMYIWFHSDYSNSFLGFRLTFEAIDQQSAPPVCPVNGTTLSALPGQVNYLRFPNHPSNYSNNTDCRWVINSINGSVVKVTVLEANSDIFYHIEIFDGMSESSPTLVTFYGMPPQTVYYSSGQYMYIRFTGYGSVTNSGLRVSYEAVNQPSVQTSGPTNTTSPLTSDACNCTCSCVSTCSCP